jgi:uncharacterized membrane protein
MNEAMGTVMGELIQMNSKMVLSDSASLVIGISVICFIMFLIITVAAYVETKRWWILLLLTAVSACGIAYGVCMPRIKEIHACVNGPISLERVSAVYDIVSIDGKEIVMRERQT